MSQLLIERINAMLSAPLPKFHAVCVGILADCISLTEAQLIAIVEKIDTADADSMKVKIGLSFGKGLSSSKNNSLTLLVIAAHFHKIKITIMPASTSALFIEFKKFDEKHTTISGLAEIISREGACS